MIRSSAAVRLLGTAVVGTLALAVGATSATAAGFTDSTHGAAELLTVGPPPEALPTSQDLSSGSTLSITAAGDLYIGGLRSNGNGNGGTPAGITPPDRVRFPAGVSIVDAIGATNDGSTAWSNANSYMALDDAGGVWTWGQAYALFGGPHLIGRGSITAAESRTVGMVTRTAEGGMLPPIRSIARMENQFLALDGTGTLWAWGYGGENIPKPSGSGDAPLPTRANRATYTPSFASCTGSGGNVLGEVPWHSVWGGLNRAGAVGQNGLIFTWGFENDPVPGAANGIVNTICPAVNERANRVLFQKYPGLYRTPDGRVYDESVLATETARHRRFTEIVDAMKDKVLSQCSGVKGVGKVDESDCPVRQLVFPSQAQLQLLQSGELYAWKASTANYGDPFIARELAAASPYWPALVGMQFPSIRGLRFSEVSAGISSVQALTREGRVYGWGWNNYCQAIGTNADPSCDTPRNLPLSPSRDMVVKPTPVAGLPAGDPVAHISTTQCAAWATTRNGDIFAWGGGTVAGSDFRYCVEPAASARGYKIYDFNTAVEGSPFGDPFIGRAANTRRVAG